MAISNIDGWQVSYHEYKRLTKAEAQLRLYVLYAFNPYRLSLDELIQKIQEQIDTYPPGMFTVKKSQCGQIIGMPKTATFSLNVSSKNKPSLITIYEPSAVGILRAI